MSVTIRQSVHKSERHLDSLRVCLSISQSDKLTCCSLHMLSGHEEVWWPQQDETEMSLKAVPSEVKGKRLINTVSY